jgi:hypothetical protein
MKGTDMEIISSVISLSFLVLFLLVNPVNGYALYPAKVN